MKKVILIAVLLLSACNRYIGKEYLGKPYLDNPLGEGMAPDSDPLIRTDAFDCQTFIETSLAKGDLNKMNAVRYKNGKIGFLNRNHFFEYDWINNNNNLVHNVSSEYGKTKIRSAIIDKKGWFKKVYNMDTDFKPQRIALEYVPYENIPGMKMPEKPLVVGFVAGDKGMKEKIGSDLVVTHVGFLLPNGKLRHASSEKGKVVDMDFIEYAARRSKDKTNLGVAFFEIKQ